MASITIPKSGLPLFRTPDAKTQSSTLPRPRQVMRLNLESQDTKSLLQSLQEKEKVRIRFGKNQFLNFGEKQIQIFAQSETCRSELYVGNSDKEDGLCFSGELSHKLGAQEVHKVMENTDAALAKLQKTMKELDQAKASNEARIVDRGTAGHKRNISSHLSPLPNQRLMSGKPRTPNSPIPGALSGSSTPRAGPMSVPLGATTLSEEDQIKLAAIKTPLVHMLAVEPHTLKELRLKLHCPKELCKRLLQRHAEEVRGEPGLYELRDKMFKELDVWKFSYPSQDVRQKAIERAITAFDKMRVTRKDEAWQMLLPKEGRGKGTVLSRTNLEGTLLPKPATPRPVESDGERKAAVAGERGRLNVENKKPTARSSSQQLVTKPIVPPKDEQKAKAKPRVTKKEALPSKKPVARPDNSKFKSSEFVQDSDDDASMSEAPPVRKGTKPTVKSSTAAPTQRDRLKPAKSPLGRKDDASPSQSTRPRTDSSPRKPSPLGSSPPTNATDNDVADKTSTSSATTSPPLSQDPSVSKSKPPKPQKALNQSHAATPKPLTNGLKRKAETLTNLPEPKRRAPSPVAVPAERDRAPRHERPSATPNNNHALTASRTSGGSTTSGSASPPDHEQLEQKARAFKAKWEKYRDFHELIALKGRKASAEEMGKLRRMQGRIRDLKKEIWKEWDGRERCYGC